MALNKDGEGKIKHHQTCELNTIGNSKVKHSWADLEMSVILSFVGKGPLC